MIAADEFDICPNVQQDHVSLIRLYFLFAHVQENKEQSS